MLKQHSERPTVLQAPLRIRLAEPEEPVIAHLAGGKHQTTIQRRSAIVWPREQGRAHARVGDVLVHADRRVPVAVEGRIERNTFDARRPIVDAVFVDNQQARTWGGLSSPDVAV